MNAKAIAALVRLAATALRLLVKPKPGPDVTPIPAPPKKPAN